jgi:polar amino acid transport system substrate-binding protein
LPRFLLALLIGLLAMAGAACGDDDEEQPAAQSTATAEAAACEPDQLPLKQDGTLTVGTDKPAFPPYFEDDDPSNGKGFESAVAYAVAEQLGLGDSVEWTVVPFNASYAPGPKDFDFDINQISITPQREKVVDFSRPYYTAPQAVVTPKNSEFANAQTFAELEGATVGVQIGTTSLDAVNQVMKPAEQPKVFNDSNDVVTALKQGQVDAVVVDLPTAFFVTAAQVPNSKIVGQFSAPGGDSFGLLLEKDSELTECVDQAIAALEESGQLEQITNKWMGAAAGAPELR